LIEINGAARQNSAVLSFYVMAQGRHWGTPFMLGALAGFIHERQGADG
jgi:hypothetical protein